MITEQLKETLKYGKLQSPDATVSIIKADGGKLDFKGDDILTSIEVDQVALSESGAPIGGLSTGKLTVKLNTLETNYWKTVDINDFREISFQLFFENDVYSSSSYNIAENIVSEDSLELTITAYDFVQNLNVEYTEIFEEDDYPMVAAEWAKAFAAHYSFDIDVEGLAFKDKTINQPNVDNMSAKQVLSKFLEWNWAGASVQDNTLVCRTIETPTIQNVSEEMNREIATNYKGYDSKLGKHGVNTIVLALSEDVESENFAAKDETLVETEGKEIEIRLSGNPFFSTPEEREEYAPLILELAKGYNYEPHETESRLLYLNIFDTLEATNMNTTKEGVFYLPIYEYKMMYDGSLKVSVGAPQMESAETELKWFYNNPRKRTEIRVDKIEQNINATVEKVEQLEELTVQTGASIDLIDSKIEAEVIDRKMQGEFILSEVSGNMTLLEDRFKLEFTRIDGTVDEATGDLLELKTTFQVNEDGATIGKNSSPLQITISNEEISFLDGGAATAYINGQKMYIGSLEILQSIILGYHQILKYDGVQKGTIWKPVGSGKEEIK